MATKLPGKHIQLRLPIKTAVALEKISNELGVKTTQLINIIIYASEDFSCPSYTEEMLAQSRKPDGRAKVDLRMGPYAEHIAIDAAKRSGTYVGTWVKNLLIEKVKEWRNGKNIFDGRKLSNNQLI